MALSLAADAAPDPAHLARLAGWCARVEPALVSEHLAWSTWRGAYHPDLLPFPRTDEALPRIAANSPACRTRSGGRLQSRNPSHYLRIDGHESTKSTS